MTVGSRVWQLVDAVDGLVVTVCTVSKDHGGVVVTVCTVSTDHGGVVACHWSVVR